MLAKLASDHGLALPTFLWRKTNSRQPVGGRCQFKMPRCGAAALTAYSLLVMSTSIHAHHATHTRLVIYCSKKDSLNEPARAVDGGQDNGQCTVLVLKISISWVEQSLPSLHPNKESAARADTLLPAVSREWTRRPPLNAHRHVRWLYDNTGRATAAAGSDHSAATELHTSLLVHTRTVCGQWGGVSSLALSRE